MQKNLTLTAMMSSSTPDDRHDDNPMVNLEAILPGEVKTGGLGLQIFYGTGDTPFGKALLATTVRGICHLSFLDTATSAEELLQRSWVNAELIPDVQITKPLYESIFNTVKNDDRQPLTLLVKGTNFQIQVWRALLQVPFGGITTYQTIAQMIDRPTATRAVGTAIGSNSIAYLIPCHRVIRESGALGGYRWGLERKSAILGWEAGRAIANDLLRGVRSMS
jgi:AraC family transcriptional regulator, regulatory protein of adaptative response / methylated-DNA-[protein]-cysteine methyltransferase